MAKHILSVLVQNHPGVLSKVSGLFSRRGFNIESLAVGTAETPDFSRMTIIVNGDEYTVDQVSKQLNKLIDVIKVELLQQNEAVQRELVLLKVKVSSQSRSEIIQTAEIFRAKIVDVSQSTLTLEITGQADKVGAFIKILEPFGITEIVRTGIIAVRRG